MRVRLIKNGTSLFLIPSIAIVWDKFSYGHREIAFVWLKWYFCLEWGHEY